MQYVTQDMIRSMLLHIDNGRIRTAFLVAYLHGLRVSEMCALTVSDTQGGSIDCRRLKSSKRTVQPLVESVDPVLNERLALRAVVIENQLGPDDKLFQFTRQTYWRHIKRAGIAAGWPKALAKPHVLKHSIAMHLVDKIDIKDLQQYLGHKSLSSTGVYLESNDVRAGKAVANVFA